MGRRPGVKKANALANLGGQSPEIQEKIDRIAALFFDEAYERLKDKREAGAFKNLTLKELLSELKGYLRAIAKPATSLQQINVPVTPQIQDNSTRPQQIKRASVDPATRRRMREAARHYIERKPEE